MGVLLMGGKTYDCPLAVGDAPGHCSWCGLELVGRQTRWCGPECSRSFAKNHYWTDARKAARRRDRYRCVRCGAKETSVGPDGRYRSVPLEVNHKTPVLGRHAIGGCHHHLADLETLCHDCHLVETARQRAAGLLTRPA